tara:strand:+ start:339 stop:785 length:447 start_codon:yes stop_codon:yes gene_type:complete
MSSPLNKIGAETFFGLGGVLGKPLIEGFKNRKEHGGGLAGIVKGTGEQLGFGDKDQALSEINSKLDKLIGEEGDVPNPAQDPALAPQAPFQPATPLNFKEFMTSTTQDPATNGTGSAKAVFGDVRPMSVADPNINTKSSLFNKNQQNF